MPDVEFEENDLMSFKSRKILGEAQVPKIIQFLMKRGITKTARQSYYMLLSLAVTCLVLALFVYLYFVLGVGTTSRVEYKIPFELKLQMQANKNEPVTTIPQE